ncbi:rod-binding protein [Pelagovum sp. HNIBRBA483]|uniref:rod-binding protein n=1 Tax=Pelagovum sp. HNIBRBA483 TaxID=3233341 RepID=UPI0034A14D38
MIEITPLPIAPAARDERAWAAAQKLEASFLSEMLKSAGLDAQIGAFGGGAGEEHFASFLRTQHAEALVARGGIGLSEHIYQSLLERDNAP